MAVARPEAGAPNATPSSLVPGEGPIRLLVVGREVAPLLKWVTDAAKVAHLRGVGPGGAPVERE